MSQRFIEIMDTTLRDGEQTSGVSFTVSEKLTIARLLIDTLRVDRIEIASARVSEGEFEAVKKIMQWAKEAGHLNRVEILTFVDGGKSLDWLNQTGGIVQNLLTKGSLNHLTHQLKKRLLSIFWRFNKPYNKRTTVASKPMFTLKIGVMACVIRLNMYLIFSISCKTNPSKGSSFQIR